MIATNIKLQFTADNKPEFVMTANISRAEALKRADQWHSITQRGKVLDVRVKQHRERRSLDSNAYLWVLLAKMAAALNTTKDELYLEALERYGVFTHIIVKPEVVEQFKKEWRAVRDLGEVTVNGKTGVQLQCYLGSSNYDTKQMARLIDGVVSECREMGIETLPPHELESMKAAWGEKE